MVFSSMLFVFFFLTLNLLSQILIKDVKTKNIVMLVFSLVFYAWAGPKYLILLLGMTFICWIGALFVAGRRKASKIYLTITIVLCLGILGFFKYTGFFLWNIQAIFGVPEVIPNIVLPIGISFYTFQLISYVVDVYRRDVAPQLNYWELLLYASLFHQCIAGPIVRYRDVKNDLARRYIYTEDISDGISRFCVGLAKKAILANSCAVVADGLFVFDKATLEATPVAGLWLGALAYTLQIYLDFSAYSDMAIGMGLMCGLHYKENFNYPYVSDSVTDFWRRWHISLSTFFRDYVYIPLGGNRMGQNRQIINLFIVWALTGLWHGANWNFVIWGLYYFVFLTIEKVAENRVSFRMPKIGAHILTLLIVVVGWVIFKFTDLSLLGTALKGMVGLNGNGFLDTTIKLTFKNNMFMLLVSMLACLPLVELLRDILENKLNVVYRVWDMVHPVILLVLSAMALAGDSYNPFLYFQF